MIAVALLAIAGGLSCAAGTLTLAWTGGSWNDGGSLAGTFTVTYNDSTGQPETLVSADVVTGNALDGFIGQNYFFDTAAGTNDLSSWMFDADQYDGSPANELVLNNVDGYRIFLDWQGTDPSTLWLGNVDGQYSSENTPSYSIVRTLNTAGGSVGEESSAPEPASFLLLGSGLLGLGMAFRKTRKR